MDPPTIYLVQLHNHKRYGDPEWENYCGYSIYDNSTFVGSNLPGYVPINQNIWRKTKDQRFIDDDGFSPLAMEAHSWTNDDVGIYEYKFVIRVSDVNTEEISSSITITINITPCVTFEVLAPTFFEPEIIYFASPHPTYQYWSEFEQFPLCNYTWTYDVFGT